MAELPRGMGPATDRADEDRAPSSPAKPALLSRLLTKEWLITLLVISLILHVVVISSFRLSASPPEPQATREMSLGKFAFSTSEPQPGQVARATFSLHVALPEGVDAVAQRQVADRKFRLRQDVEELVREAHSADFDDPVLAGLKRQLLERLNHTLGLRAVAEVVITDLSLERLPPEAVGSRQ